MSTVVAVKQVIGAGLGASEVAAAIGLSPWERPIELWKRKTGRAPAKASNDAMYWGTRLEPLIRAEYCERNGVEVEVPSESVYHPHFTWARATPDGYALVDGKRSHLIQCKAPGHLAAPKWGDDGHREVPDDYVAQAAWEMFVTDMPKDVFCVLLGGRTYFEIAVERNAELEQAIVDSATEFWMCVCEDSEPAYDNSEAHLRHLVSKIQRGGLSVKADEKIEAMTSRWREVVLAQRDLETEERAIKGMVAQFMASTGAARVETSSGRIYVQNASAHYDYKALAQTLTTTMQLHGIDIDFVTEREKFKNPPGAPSLRRPNKWTEE